MSCRNLAKLLIKMEPCDTTKACVQAQPFEKGYYLTEKEIVEEVREVVTAPAIRRNDQQTGRVEACPNTALEAVAYSRLVISTRHLPMPEFSQDAAFYYNEGDTAALAHQVEHALALPTPTKNARKEACRHIAERFRRQETTRLTVDHSSSALQ